MTSKGFAQLYRDVADRIAESDTTLDREDIKIAGMLRKRASEHDPPKPRGGTVVWWRYKPKHASSPCGPWELGITAHAGDGIYAADGKLYPWDRIEWDEARVWGDPSNA